MHSDRVGDIAPAHALAAQLKHARHRARVALGVRHRPAHQCGLHLLRSRVVDTCTGEIATGKRRGAIGLAFAHVSSGRSESSALA